jgi:hypothetical protein
MQENTTPTLTESIPTSVPTVARRVGLIMTYNQRETCIEAINSLVTQTLALDLIIISDDCSTDGTYEVIKNYLLQDNQHNNIKVYQSEKKLGFIPHYNTVIKDHCAESDLIYYNAGDDISEVNRVEEFYREYEAKGSPRHFLGHSYVTSFGAGKEEILVPPIETIKDNREICLIASAYHIGASQVFTGALFFDFGPILFDDCYEDLTLGYRALLKNAYHFIPKALLRYRTGGLSSWQKNPLEKKRLRLKSTLTQRAVDSIRSGDFAALSTIQDCYSQYGFSHIPYRQRTAITVVSEQPGVRNIHAYSIADHFPVVGNVCQVTLKSSRDSLGLLMSNSQAINTLSEATFWLILPRIEYKYFQQLIAISNSIRNVNIILDMGLLEPSEPISCGMTVLNFALVFIRAFPNTVFHTSSQKLFDELSIRHGLQNGSYLPPLQNIDGPDPTFKRPLKKRGAIIILGPRNSVEPVLSTIRTAHDSYSLDFGELRVIERADQPIVISADTRTTRSNNEFLSAENIDLTSLDYLIVLNGLPNEYEASTLYWWTLSAKYCLPIFMNSESSRLKVLQHGENCLFVNSDITSWNFAMSLVQREYNALHLIASRARRDVYFSFSIQKKIMEVSRLVGKINSSEIFYDKFLPL